MGGIRRKRKLHENPGSAVVTGMVMLALFMRPCSLLHAQSYRGAIRGVVRDPSGAVIVGADVTAKNKATGLSRNAVSADDGVYVIAELPAGVYDVTAEAKSFGASIWPGVVEVGSETTLDFVLSVGAHEGTVTVTAVSPLIEASQTDLATDVQNRLVEELPLNGRDFGKLVALVPGATVEGSGVAGSEKGTGQFNINGNRDRSNNYTLDGTDNNDSFHNNSALNQVGIGGAPASLLPLDAIQEFNLQGQFPAEYGRNSGSVVNIITKSGSNDFHGSAYEYHRNSFFDARNFFNAVRDTEGNPVRQSRFVNNNFGGSVGGPIVHNKTFFFAAAEGQRERVGSDFTLFVPTVSDRAAAIALAKAQDPTISTGPTDALLARFFPAIQPYINNRT
jgi:hypothetical protein